MICGCQVVWTEDGSLLIKGCEKHQGFPDERFEVSHLLRRKGYETIAVKVEPDGSVLILNFLSEEVLSGRAETRRRVEKSALPWWKRIFRQAEKMSA